MHLFSLQVRQAIEGERFLDATHVDAVGMGSGSFVSTQDHDVMLQQCNDEPHHTVEDQTDPTL